jgi:predicted nucleic acid-binding Zn ribbon protein
MDDETIEGRFALVDDRLEHFGERIAALEQTESDEAKEHTEKKRSRRELVLELIVIALVAIEVIQGFWPHHA